MDAARPTRWQSATVVAVVDETPTVRTFRLRLDDPQVHRAGQHYVVRLTAPDGYQASRSYSVASAPDQVPLIDLTVERLPGGEVSGFLHDEVAPGDELEVRGPLGGWFVWEGDAPALLVGGGSGMVPLMAMLRHARSLGRADLVRLVVSVRAPADEYYSGEMAGPETTVLYSREAPPGWARPPGRLAAADLDDAVAHLLRPGAAAGRAYVCGSSGFADAATAALTGLGVAAGRIRVERFGTTGGAAPDPTGPT